MTKRFLLLGGAVLAAAGALHAAFVWRQETNKAFSVGEALVYDVRYGVVPSGRAEQRVEGIVDVDGRRAYHIVSEASSNKTVDAFRKIREKQETWLDVESLCALKFVDNVREGRYRRNSVTIFRPPEGRFTHTYKTSKSEGEETHEMPPFSHDILSVVYFLRTRDLKPGDEIVVHTLSGGEVWPVKIRAEKTEKIKVAAGKFECLHLVPVLEKKKKDGPKGRLEVWLTNDERKIPIKIRTDLGVGSFEARLREHTPGTGTAVPASTGTPPPSPQTETHD